MRDDGLQTRRENVTAPRQRVAIVLRASESRLIDPRIRFATRQSNAPMEQLLARDPLKDPE
jgi:hypothetical protein